MQKIVLDTNVLISAMFFGNVPKIVVDYISNDYNFKACASNDIIREYRNTNNKMILKGFVPKYNLEGFIASIEIIKTTSTIKICRDPDDNKFLNCAVDAKAIYMVSGDNDLLSIRDYNTVHILTAREFYEAVIMEE